MEVIMKKVIVMESILTSIKKLLGITENDTSYDIDIIIHINTYFSVLHENGVGPDECFTIFDKTSLWNDFISLPFIEDVKTYIYLRVKIIFDPPSNPTVLNAYKSCADELEYRLKEKYEDYRETEEH